MVCADRLIRFLLLLRSVTYCDPASGDGLAGLALDLYARLGESVGLEGEVHDRGEFASCLLLSLDPSPIGSDRNRTILTLFCTFPTSGHRRRIDIPRPLLPLTRHPRPIQRRH
jgi:hypothetical protein